MLGDDEIGRRVGYHRAGPATMPVYELNRALIGLVMSVWDQALPPGRELALAFTELEAALMRANQAVACNADPTEYVVPEVDVATRLDDVLDRLEGPTLTRSGPDPRFSDPAGTVVEVPGTFSSPPVELTPEQVQGLTPREPTHLEPRPVADRAIGMRDPGEGPELSRIRGDKHLDGPILTRSGADEPRCEGGRHVDPHRGCVLR